MLNGVPVAYWIGFHVLVLVLIVCDLAVLNHGLAAARERAPSWGKKTGGNLAFVLLLLALAAAFGLWLAHVRGHEAGLEFASGYLIEISLSVDNLFVFVVMFRAFGLSLAEQRKLLLYGVLGAIVMRGIFIFGGIALLRRFSWIQFVFGGFLVIAALRLARKTEASPGRRPARWVRWLSGHGIGKRAGVLLAAVIAIEAADLIFALDSIPAVLAVTDKPFVAYTSNIFAVLGLRSLYFLLANLLERLRFLHFGLGVVLAFVGVKMILARWIPIPIGVSLGVILAVLVIATVASYPPQERGN